MLRKMQENEKEKNFGPHIKRKSSTAGGGCLLQLLGLISIGIGIGTFFSIIGPIILIPLGLWLLVYGGRKAIWFECSECGSKLSNKNIKICPGCNSIFNKK